MENTENKFEYIEGSFILLSQEIADLMSEYESELECAKDEEIITSAKRRLEKLEEVSVFLDEAEGKFAELREENQFVG